ncbi:MAG: hypothetical protein PHD87_01395 [Candidatus Cloacimonetes bacterium]|nr:hypothetical protein [Candidatus Cloacimonadota bacterium]
MPDENTILTFFLDEVHLEEQLLMTAKYRVLNSGAVIEVDNGMHIRLVDNQMKLPEFFRIIASVMAIKGMDGTLNKESLVKLPASEYLKLRMKHHGA